MNEQWQLFLEQHNNPQKNSSSSWFCELSSWSILNVQEGDAARFLQGQLTCDLDQIGTNKSILGACCNAKGRMLSNFRILGQRQGYWLIMDRSLIDDNIAALNKYAVFFRSKLSNAENTLVGIGINGADGAALLQHLGATLPAINCASDFRNGKLICVDEQNPRFQVWLPVEQATSLWLEFAKNLLQVDPQTWNLVDIRQGIAWINAGNKEMYTPHQYNLQAVGGISFRKGCYTGQEIVSRMQHLGKLKNRMYRVSYKATTNHLPAQIHDSSGKNIGEIISQALDEQSGLSEALAIIRDTAVEANQLQLDSEVSVNVLELPYTITNKEHLTPEK